MKNPITTLLSIIVALGVLARAATLMQNGQAPDMTEVTLAVTAIAGAIGLYKAVDPGKGLVVLIALAGALAGCSNLIGPSGAYEGYFGCKGKGTITGSGQLNLGAGIGGSGSNSFTLVMDCGDGLTIERDRSRTKE